MTCNGFYSCYSTCYNPCNYCYDVCRPQNICSTIYNPCQPINNVCQNICATTCNPCGVVSQQCPEVAYIAAAATPTVLPTGVATTISGFTGIPIRNVGGIINNVTTGQFTVPCAGRYEVSGFVSFPANATGTRQLDIYVVDGTTGAITLAASDTRNAALTGPTNITLTTVVYLKANDRVYLSATQNSGTTLTTIESRISIVRLC